MIKEKAETLLENYQALSELYNNTRKELERTHKALDVAVDAFKNATEYLSNQEPLVDVMAMNLYIDLSKALEQITALTKGGGNE